MQNKWGFSVANASYLLPPHSLISPFAHSGARDVRLTISNEAALFFGATVVVVYGGVIRCGCHRNCLCKCTLHYFVFKSIIASFPKADLNNMLFLLSLTSLTVVCVVLFTFFALFAGVFYFRTPLSCKWSSGFWQAMSEVPLNCGSGLVFKYFSDCWGWNFICYFCLLFLSTCGWKCHIVSGICPG